MSFPMIEKILSQSGNNFSSNINFNLMVSKSKIINAPGSHNNKAIYSLGSKTIKTPSKLPITPKKKKTQFKVVATKISKKDKLREHFRELGIMYQLLNDKYRAGTFSKAIDKIDDIKDLNNLKGIPGFGPSVISEVKEFLSNGTTKRYKDLRKKTDKARKTVELFSTIHGIGLVKATKLYNSGYRTMKEVLEAEKSGKIELTKAQKIGFKYYDDIKLKIPRKEIDEYMKIIPTVVPELNNYFTIAGSYRRGESTSSDIDVMIKHHDKISLKSIVKKLKEMKIIIATLALGEKKFMGISRLKNKIARRMDIRFFKASEWAYALLYNTGSQTFNILSRQRAIELNMRLSEYGLFPNDSDLSLPAETEEDIFKYLGIKYLAPEERLKTLTSLELI